MNSVIACVKNQVLPSIMASHDGNYIRDLPMLNSLYFRTLLCVIWHYSEAERTALRQSANGCTEQSVSLSDALYLIASAG